MIATKQVQTKVEIEAQIERADGTVEHVRLVDGKWITAEKSSEEHGDDDQTH